MNLPLLNFQETELGWFAEDDQVQVFFGGVNSSKERLGKHHPGMAFRQAKQVHGNVIIEDQSQSLDGLEADGLIGKLAQNALCILTADCTPILIHDPSSGQVAALHAGWRGVANRILPKALQLFPNPQGLRLWVGPHILQSSFEVRRDALDLLQVASSAKLESYAQSNGPDTHLVDLREILKAQMSEFSIKTAQVQFLNLDTRTDPRLHSYRRDGKNAGRQTSFIVLKF